MSSAGGVENAPLNAALIKATAFAFFTKNQKQWQSKPLSAVNIDKFKQNCRQHDLLPGHILPHDSYLINLGHPDADKLQMSRHAFLVEMQRCQQLGLLYLNFHPGSSLGLTSEEKCLETVADSINYSISRTAGVNAVIENTAGQGNCVGYSFNHLKRIIDLVENKTRIGICLDTCHLFAAGYDLRSLKDYERTMNEFDHIVGFSYLKGLHLNDARAELGSRIDRHASLGEGKLGWSTFRRIVNDYRFEELPLILETPAPEKWEKEISMLYSMIHNTDI